ncbi:MAG: hypothetical protein F4Y71_10620 [Acidobacteria bacterium]|nr:hypothetical protein [Acidobacteriota bacterium]
MSESSQERSDSERNVGADFGLSNALASLLRVNLSATGRDTSGTEAARISKEDRVHTPASLFFVLRDMLVKKNLLQQDGTESPEVGTFLEFSSRLSRNPVIEVIDALQQVMGLASVFQGTEGTEERSSGKRANRQSSSSFENTLQKMDQFSNTLRAGDTIDLTSAPLESGHRAVVTVESQYLNDPSMGDIVDGTFSVVGKVTSVLPEGQGAISLIRKTPLAILPREVRENAFSGLNALSTGQGFGLPRIEWEINAPVVQILPIAIYT